jgi:hypothetical protein
MGFLSVATGTLRDVLFALWVLLLIASIIAGVWYWKLRDRDIIHARLPVVNLVIIFFAWLLLVSSLMVTLFCT